MSVGEKQMLLAKSHLNTPTENEDERSVSPKKQFLQHWGGTPGLRQQWNKSTDRTFEFHLSDDENIPNNESSVDDKAVINAVGAAIRGIPGLLIAITLNLFLSISFGQAFFPANWEFPSEVPRAVGIQMFLFSTVICQLVMTWKSDFPCAMGMMMVENIPFMHTIAQTVIARQGQDIDALSTVLVAFALSSVIVGVFFYVLGFFKLGNAVYFFPRHVIVGCIGGVGVFVAQTGFEVSTNRTWEWSRHSILVFSDERIWPLWAASCAFEVVLRVLLAVLKLPLLPPFYFVLIPPVFYAILFVTGLSLGDMMSSDWFFQSAKDSDFRLMWTLMNFNTVRWDVIAELIPTMIALTIFSLMHVPINIPSLSISTKTTANMNRELMAHGISNILVGLGGGLQNYLCYSNSLLYFKCRGGGKVSGFLLAALTAIFFFLGPSVIHFVPRCMAGCLLIHVGIDLMSEALVDSYQGFDHFEYGSILIITATMTAFGMTAGLGAGVVLAAVTFTSQTSKYIFPIRGQMTAATVRSTARRSARFYDVLHTYSKHIHIMQLQGNIFFGNATTLSTEITDLLLQSQGEIWCLLLDFTLVLTIDSSAVETIASLPALCFPYKVKLCFARGSNLGFPCEANLSSRLSRSSADGRAVSTVVDGDCEGKRDLLMRDIFNADLSLDTVYVDSDVKMNVSDDLNAALKWCEDQVAVRAEPYINPIDPLYGREHIRLKPAHLRQMYFLYPDDDAVSRLLMYFTGPPVHYSAGTILWRQADRSTTAVLVVTGVLLSILEEEAGTVTELPLGFLLGEYGLINGKERSGTLKAKTDVSVLVLSLERFRMMERDDPASAYVLCRICMAFLEFRVRHVANRIWESKCLPI